MYVPSGAHEKKNVATFFFSWAPGTIYSGLSGTSLFWTPLGLLKVS